MLPVAMAQFRFDGQRLAYTTYGRGERVTVLLPGLLLSQQMQIPLARELAAQGNRVVTLDPLGHGRSARPVESWRYSMSAFAHQTVALLDHLGIDRAVIGGTSLGANVTLEVALQAPERLAGMILEMPVLDNAVLACAAAFTPLLFALKFGEPAMRALGRATNALPRGPLPFMVALGVDFISQDPAPSAAVLGGILYGRVAPDHHQRVTFSSPALVIGHPRDPMHPFSDAGMLAAELPNAELLRASSILELRLRPQRLTAEIARFVQACWAGAREPTLPARSGRQAG